jgi:autotransporter passenger strand-loop-strand repeat protein
MIAIRQPHRSGVTVLFGGTEVVPSGGTASNTVASSGGVLVVLSRGLADQTTIYSGGSETVSSGGTVHDIAVSSGGALDVAGSTTSKVTVSSGGVETISSGGIAGGRSGQFRHARLRPPIELGGRPHGAGAGLGTTAQSTTRWRGPAARSANPRRSKTSPYRSRLSVRRGAGRPTVAGHFTTAVRLAPRRLPIRAVGRWAMSREKEPAPGGRATNEIVEEIVDNLRPWKGGKSVAAITAAVNDQLAACRTGG